MKIRSLLMGAAVAATATGASAFQWTPASLYPNPSADITSTYFLENLSFNCYVEDVSLSDIMPVWVDEDGNEVKAATAEQNPWGFDPSAFVYTFDSDEFKSNGEYTLLFPEGMLVNAAGEKSDEVRTYYTVDVPELAPAMFDDFEVLTLSPELSMPQAIWNDQRIVINTNHNDAIGLVTLQIVDTTTDEFVVFSSNFTAGRELGDSSEIAWDVVGQYKFFEGHVYKANFTFYNGKDEVSPEGEPTRIVDRASYDFTGRVEGFKYSELTLESVEPAPYTITISEPEQAVFTYTFSGPVNIYKAVTPLGQNGMVVYPESCLSSNDDKTVWVLDLSNESYVKTVDAALTVAIYARDMEGFQLRGDFGEENESCFVFDWACDIGAKSIVLVTPSLGESIDRLSEIVVKSADGEPMAWTWNGEAYVVNQLGERLGTLVYDAPAEGEDAAAVEFRFTEWVDDFWNVTPIDLTKEGSYAVMFDAGCFVFGDQFTAVNSRNLVSTFTVTGALEEEPQPVNPEEQEVFAFEKVSPESGSTVETLDVIRIWYPEMVACEEFTVNVYNKADGSLVTTGTGMYDWDDWMLINITLAQPVTESGEYEVVVPKRVIGTDEFLSSNGSAGICNPEFTLVYTVGIGTAVESVAASASADVYDVHGRLVLRDAAPAALKTLPKGIYVVGGRKVVVK